MTSAETPQPRRVSTWTWLVAAAATAGGLSLWVLSGFNPFAAPVLALATIAAAAVAILVPTRPAAAVGVLFFVAIFERIVIDTPVGAMRVEQPAIAALLVATIWHRRRFSLTSLRDIWPLLLAAAAYIVSLAASSALVAEVPAESLRLVLWSALSMAAGLTAAVLLRDRVREIVPWLVGAAAFAAVLGLLVAVSYVLFGRWSGAIGGAPGSPRVFLPAYEPNLYASLLATSVPLAAEQFRARPTRRNLILLALPLLALGLGITRAAYIGLAVGMLLFLLLHIRRGGWTRVMTQLSAVVAVTGFVGLVLPALILNPDYAGLLRPAVAAVTDPNPAAPVTIGDPAPPRSNDRPRDELDTLEYRLERVRTGLDEWRASPIIGRGAYSYGQRHIDPTHGEEVIAVLPVLVLHDSGIIGLAALSAFLALLALLVWRTSGAPEIDRRAPAIALGSALMVMLVGYLSTSALHFAVTWIVIGCTVAAAWPRPSRA